MLKNFLRESEKRKPMTEKPGVIVCASHQAGDMPPLA
jgi:hypothetical protein